MEKKGSIFWFKSGKNPDFRGFQKGLILGSFYRFYRLITLHFLDTFWSGPQKTWKKPLFLHFFALFSKNFGNLFAVPGLRKKWTPKKHLKTRVLERGSILGSFIGYAGSITLHFFGHHLMGSCQFWSKSDFLVTPDLQKWPFFGQFLAYFCTPVLWPFSLSWA